MNYKEKYENPVEAVKKLQKVNPSDEGIQNWINDNVPELKESGDEKIKKALFVLFAGVHSSMYPYKGFTKEQILAWIEKQGEQKPAVIIPKFRVGDTIRIKNSDAEYTITEISDGYYRGKGWCLDIAAGDKCGDYELVEHKSWSEENENCINYILINCIHYAEECGHVEELHNDELHKQAKEWLKSLRPQSHWIPSEEQMIALKCAITTADEKWVCMNTKDLESLYEDLKKLKG